MKNVRLLLILLLFTACSRNSRPEKTTEIRKDTLSSVDTASHTTEDLTGETGGKPADTALLNGIINKVNAITIPAKIETGDTNEDKWVLLSPEEITILIGSFDQENKSHLVVIYAVNALPLKEGTGVLYHIHSSPRNAEDEDMAYMDTSDEILLVLYDKNGIQMDMVSLAIQEYDASGYSVINSRYEIVYTSHYETEDINILQSTYAINNLKIEYKEEKKREFKGNRQGADAAQEFLRKFEKSMGL